MSLLRRFVKADLLVLSIAAGCCTNLEFGGWRFGKPCSLAEILVHLACSFGSRLKKLVKLIGLHAIEWRRSDAARADTPASGGWASRHSRGSQNLCSSPSWEVILNSLRSMQLKLLCLALFATLLWREDSATNAERRAFMSMISRSGIMWCTRSMK